MGRGGEDELDSTIAASRKRMTTTLGDYGKEFTKSDGLLETPSKSSVSDPDGREKLLLTTILGKDEKSEAFVRGYEDDLHDDAMDDFAHLAQDEMEVDENDENEEPTETVDASEVQAQLRLAAQNSKRKGKVSELEMSQLEWSVNLIAHCSNDSIRSLSTGLNKQIGVMTTRNMG